MHAHVPMHIQVYSIGKTPTILESNLQNKLLLADEGLTTGFT